MINVQYPFLDLSDALLMLSQNLHANDKAKATLYKSYKINTLLNYLFEIHTQKLGFPTKAVTLNISAIDTLEKIELSGKTINQLAEALKSGVKLTDVSDKDYAGCWLLQQYIRHALNNQELLHYNYYHPFLEMTMQCLANHYKGIDATEGALIKIEIVGEAGGVWFIEKSGSGWQQVSSEKSPDTVLYLDQQIAWLLFTDALHVNEIGQFYQILGDKRLGIHFLSFRTMLLR